MELTIAQVLQQGIAAHNAGNLQEAERAYQAILQSQPKHPEANHKLGLIAISVNQIEAALPLFKVALDVNPNIEQFWMSYTDALVKNNQLKDAKQAIKKAKKKGFDAKKLQVLLYQSNGRVDTKVLSQVQVNTLLEHCQNGRFGDAEKLALSVSKEFPQHQFAWKVLGVIFGQSGRNSEALNANQMAVALSPEDPEAHSNLGIALQKMGRLDEAEASASKALALKPDYAEAHYNLGITLQELGRLDEAQLSYTQALALKPDFTEAHSNLGNTLKELGKSDEAEASYIQAIALKPDYAEAYSNLGNLHKELGRLDDAKVSYTQAIALKPNFAEAHSNLAATLQEWGRSDEAEASYNKAIALKPGFAGAHFNLGVTLEALGRFNEAEVSYTQAIALKPNFADAHNNLLRCLYLLDKQALFFDKLDFLINKETANATTGSLTSRSALKYGVDKSNLFCRKPLQYVSHIDMNSQYDFEEVFAKKVRIFLNENRISNRKQSLLVNGYQTSGNLFNIKNSFTDEIQKAIRLEIEKYRVNFKDSKDGLIKKWPIDYSLYGWLISMKSGGELKPHIHSNGWLSGSLYINVPPDLKADSGRLVVSLGEEKDATDTRINVENIINVVTGSLVLFPASLTHYTIPFDAEEDRIVLAFDVKRND